MTRQRLLRTIDSEPVRIGKQLETLREARGLQQKFAAERVGMSQSYLSQIENGTRQPNALHLQKLAQLYGASEQELAEIKRQHDIWREKHPNILDDLHGASFIVISPVDPALDRLLRAVRFDDPEDLEELTQYRLHRQQRPDLDVQTEHMMAEEQAIYEQVRKAQRREAQTDRKEGSERAGA